MAHVVLRSHIPTTDPRKGTVEGVLREFFTAGEGGPWLITLHPGGVSGEENLWEVDVIGQGAITAFRVDAADTRQALADRVRARFREATGA
jgi:hypothetical protein